MVGAERERPVRLPSGISSTIDEPLFIFETVINDIARNAREAEQATRRMQLSIQYNPQLLYPGGDPCSVDYSVYAPAAEGMKPFRDAVCKAVTQRLRGQTAA